MILLPACSLQFLCICKLQLYSTMQKKTLLFSVIFLLLTHRSLSQRSDSTNNKTHFSGTVSVTNNGISLVPTFSLGKPAVIFNLSLGKKRLSFEPDMRFALEGKPWSFLFWWRYKLVQDKKFRVTLGAHPALNFKTSTVILNGVSKDLLIARRYLAGELVPNYTVGKNISVGMYYLYSRGIDRDAPRNTHFLTLNSNFSAIKLYDKYFMKFVPQLYYLKQDKLEGYYGTATITLARRGSPFSLSSTVNKTIRTDIVSKEFVWNLNLVYAFKNSYAKQK